MFYLYALGSMLGYALQDSLSARYARQMDGLSFAFYRNLSFAITLSPLLIGSSRAEFVTVFGQWELLLLGGFSGGLFLAFFYASFRHLPVGIAVALTHALLMIFLTVIGWIFLGDILSPVALALIACIIIGGLLLAFTRNSHAHLRGRVALGIALAVAAAIPLTGTNYTPAALSRVADPLVSGYLWELSIAAGAGILLFFRWIVTRQPIQRVDARTFLGIALAVSPTLIGTGFFTLATRAGPVAVVSAIGSASLVVTSLLSWHLYREHLRWTQWAAILLVLAGVAGLKFA